MSKITILESYKENKRHWNIKKYIEDNPLTKERLEGCLNDHYNMELLYTVNDELYVLKSWYGDIKKVSKKEYEQMLNEMREVHEEFERSYRKCVKEGYGIDIEEED